MIMKILPCLITFFVVTIRLIFLNMGSECESYNFIQTGGNFDGSHFVSTIGKLVGHSQTSTQCYSISLSPPGLGTRW